MTNKEWLSTLSDEEFYDQLKRVEQTEGMWSTDTRRYMIDWLDAEHAGGSEPVPKKIAITEEMKVHEEWYKQVEDIETLESLTAFVNHVMTDYYHDYGTACHAVAACALAGAWYGANVLGISHFQASLVMWVFIQHWIKRNNVTGLRLVDYDDMLYPQYRYKFEKTIAKGNWEALQKEAMRLLADKDRHASVDVENHWKSIAEGIVPFGYTVED